jgi:hypothetical protein
MSSRFWPRLVIPIDTYQRAARSTSWPTDSSARMCAAGIGTDTGGSVRIPAALCGIVGLRVTVGRYPAKGTIPLAHTRDTAGPMADQSRISFCWIQS